MYLTFVGDIEPGMQINHIDGNTQNNSLSNLELVTPSQNRQHSIVVLGSSRHGGFITKKKKLSYAEVVEICSYLYNTALPLSILADMYKISGTAVRYINIGRNYRWLTEPLLNDYPIRSRAK